MNPTATVISTMVNPPAMFREALLLVDSGLGFCTRILLQLQCTDQQLGVDIYQSRAALGLFFSDAG